MGCGREEQSTSLVQEETTNQQLKPIEPYCFYPVHAVFISHATAYKYLKFNVIISTFSIGMVESEGMLHWHILLLT